jgi:hypothetical protein
MKELDPLKKDQIEIHAQAEQKSEQYENSMFLKKGMKLWEIPASGFDPETMRPKDVTPKSDRVHWDEATGKARVFDPYNPQISIPFLGKPNHFYCTALNERNAIKKFIQFKLRNLRK